MSGQTGNDGTKIEIMVPLKYLRNFWRTLEMLLINCEINLILIWSANCVIVSLNNANQNATFEITDTKLYVPVVTLSTQDSSKLLHQLKSGFKRVINWNTYLLKPEILRRNPNLNHLVEPSFQGVNKLFVSAFENDKQITSAKGYYLPNVEIIMKSVIKSLDKRVLVPLELTAAASAADAGIQKKILGSGHNNRTLMISNDEM